MRTLSLASMLVLAAFTMLAVSAEPVDGQGKRQQSPPQHVPVATPDITGYWEFEGDQDGTVYKGVLIIVRHGSGVGIRWMNDGGQVSVGAAMWMEDGSLIASSGGGGVVRYKLSPDGKSMDGKWIGGSGTINSEKLKFLKRRD